MSHYTENESPQLIPYDVFYNIASFSDYETTKNLSFTDRTLNQMINKKFVNKKYLDKYKRFTDNIPLDIEDYYRLYEKFSTDLDFLLVLVNDPNTNFKNEYNDMFHHLLSFYTEPHDNFDVNKYFNLLNIIIKKPYFDINFRCWFDNSGVKDSYFNNDMLLYNFLINNGFKADLKKCSFESFDTHKDLMKYYVDAGIDPNIFNSAAGYWTNLGVRFYLDDVQYMLNKGSDPTDLLHQFIYSLYIDQDLIDFINLDAIELILNKGPNISKKDYIKFKRFINEYLKIRKNKKNSLQINNILKMIENIIGVDINEMYNTEYNNNQNNEYDHVNNNNNEYNDEYNNEYYNYDDNDEYDDNNNEYDD